MFAKATFDVCVIGHVTRDIVRIQDAEKEMPGGTAYYFSIALKSLGANVALVTKAAEKDLPGDLLESGVRIYYKRGKKTTVFENVYPEGPDVRVQNVRCVAQPFSTGDIPDISAQIFHLGPLTNRDIPLEILKRLSKKAKISLDVQGFLREVEKGRVKSTDWEEKEEGLACVDVLKADEAEAKILSGESKMKKAAAKLSTYGACEVVITLGSRGSLIYSGGKFYSIPAFPVRKVVDATGCGDTYMAGYTYKRLNACGIDKSGRFAAAASSLKLGRSGPFSGSEGSVQKFLRSVNARTQH